ncbi:MAG: UDP-glucose:undecaprenyl-phosphate glucose-1-phosphate transferase [Syntrophorhabdus sp. PtaU1.Bin050]|nr:MAG: UDP-glucose:undecaprenyl-phosphate glucose-1-phosphate transferase [Syntrophorhabdus sp. PtaU1.Bin050]
MAVTTNICAPLIDHDYGLYVQDYFQELLRMERKRTERSKNPFLLLLLEIDALGAFDDKRETIGNIAHSLAGTTREIDVRGWYQYPTIIGIMFREMTGVDGYSSKVRDRILKRLYINLAKVLGETTAKKIRVSSHVFPEELGRHESAISMADINLYPDIFANEEPSRKVSKAIKQVLDITLSGIFLVASLPLFVIIALFIKLSSAGPVFFRQERVGLRGKPFTFLKFRSMYISDNSAAIHKEYVEKFIAGKGAAKEEKSSTDGVYKIIDDPRVTPFGKFLRKSSMDELPQFINVLKGEMSLVGPRPPIPYEYKMYDIWHRTRLLEVKPGITGLWQVRGRSSTTFDEMVRLDLQYAKEWSFWLDIKILLKTPWAVISGKGAY